MNTLDTWRQASICVGCAALDAAIRFYQSCQMGLVNLDATDFKQCMHRVVVSPLQPIGQNVALMQRTILQWLHVRASIDDTVGPSWNALLVVASSLHSSIRTD